jgi:hypothetical protein
MSKAYDRVDWLFLEGMMEKSHIASELMVISQMLCSKVEVFSDVEQGTK